MQTVTLNLTPGSVAPVVYASQNDDGRAIRFMLVDGDINNSYSLNGLETITANLTKPDGTETTIAITNPGSGKNYVDLVNGASDYDQAGVYLGEIVLTRNATVLGTGNFVLEVEADAYGSEVEVRSASGIIASFNTALSEPLVSLKCNFLCSGGNGTPSTPIPLVPLTELNVTRTGVNFTDIADNIISGAGYVIGGFPVAINADNVVLPSGNYVFSFDVQNATYPCACQLIWYRNGVEVGNTVESISASGIILIAFTSSGEFDSFAMFCNSSSGGEFTNFNLNIGSTPSAYEPYNGQTITLDLDGTRYGGYVDVNNGKLVVTHTTADEDVFTYYDGQTSPGGLHWVSATVDNVQNGNAICSMLEVKNTDDGWISNTPCMTMENGRLIIYTDRTDLAEFKTYYDGLQIAYELATPIEVDITPAFLSAIQGQNNVFHDGNGTVELEYLDLKV